MPALVACLIWLIMANVIAMLPTRDHHWRSAYVLIACGLPLAVALWWQMGWLWALGFVVAGGSVLRWPVYFLLRWFRSVFRL